MPAGHGAVMAKPAVAVPEWDYNGQLYVDYANLEVIAHAQDISKTSLREQDSILYDPTDPNLGTNPERIYKFYFTAQDGTMWVTFSATAARPWSTPVQATVTGSRASEDPSVVQIWDQPGVVHRDGSGKMHMYCEDSASSDIYVYESTDGIAWTAMASQPVIARVPATWEPTLVGSPVGRHDGTNYIVGYEGIGVTYGESFGVAYGTAANSLTKNANNPVWRSTVDPLAATSIVVDDMFKAADGAVYFCAHDGVTAASPNYRGRTTNTDYTTWASGDIASIADRVTTYSADITVAGTDLLHVASSEKWTGARSMFKVPLSTTEPTIEVLDPSEIDNITWEWVFESDEITGLVDNDPISTWPDTSGNSRDATSAGGNRPIYKTNIANGQPVARFADNTDRLTTGAITALSQPTTICLCASSSAATAAVLIDGIASGNRHYLAAQTTFFEIWAGQLSTTTDSTPSATLRVFIITFDTNATRLRVGGGAGSAMSPSTNTLTGLTIGNHWNTGVNASILGDVAAVRVVNRRLTLAEMNLVGEFWKAKYGVAWSSALAVDPG